MQQKLMVGYRQRGEGFEKRPRYAPGGLIPTIKLL